MSASAVEFAAGASGVVGGVEKTYSVAEGAAVLRQSEAWYLGRLRRGELPGHRAGRKWYLTESDLRAAVELTAQPATVPAPDPVGLTPRSRRRLATRHRG
ncbi:hypothetical protein AWN90_10530 [Nocardia terpenica]|uniref:Helix-turn-helix domain-containing protein n=2 Tax=Nocardia terpenica TaxID=455432 RepID=A0A164H9N9_9NOCA|nr:hypothetical protein AWN90_10530 [Nocardia terpenica]